MRKRQPWSHRHTQTPFALAFTQATIIVVLGAAAAAAAVVMVCKGKGRMLYREEPW